MPEVHRSALHGAADEDTRLTRVSNPLKKRLNLRYDYIDAHRCADVIAIRQTEEGRIRHLGGALLDLSEARIGFADKQQAWHRHHGQHVCVRHAILSERAQGIEVVGELPRPHPRRHPAAESLIDHFWERFPVAWHEVTKWLHVLRVGVGRAENERAKALRRVLCDTKADPAAHRVSEVVRLCDAERIEYGDDIGCSQPEIVGRWIVRLVAVAMASRVEQDNLMIGFQIVHIAKLDQIRRAAGDTVV